MRWRALLVAVFLAVAACGGGHQRPSPPPAEPVTTAPSTTSTTATCTNSAVVAAWPPARQAAQLLVVPALNGDIAQLPAVIDAGIGGILLLGSSLPPGFPSATSSLRSRPVPPMVMADEEGGQVQRLSGLVASVPSPRELAATLSPAEVTRQVAETARQMVKLGVTVDLAPVLDVDDRPGPSASNPDGTRSFSGVAATAATYGTAFVDGLREGGVIAVVKHFPGLGGSTGNTDYGPAATLPLSALERSAFVPFRSAIADHVPAVMIANATTPGLSNLPASLSGAVIHDVLEAQLGFHGLVLTDSLSAGAITAAGYDLPHAAVAAVNAGADMVLFGSTLTPAETALLSPANVARSVTALVGALTSGVAPARLQAAALAVITAKQVNLCGA